MLIGLACTMAVAVTGCSNVDTRAGTETANAVFADLQNIVTASLGEWDNLISEESGRFCEPSKRKAIWHQSRWDFNASGRPTEDGLPLLNQAEDYLRNRSDLIKMDPRADFGAGDSIGAILKNDVRVYVERPNDVGERPFIVEVIGPCR